jgi:tetratricopeptide (TPR) repeat protein
MVRMVLCRCSMCMWFAAEWLKARGDELLQKQDLHGAANAYSAALEVDPVHLGCLGNRAVCRLMLGHSKAAALDCTTALMLLPEPLAPPAPPLPAENIEALERQADAAQAAAMTFDPKASDASKVALESADVRADRRATIVSAKTMEQASRLLAEARVEERSRLTPGVPLGRRTALRKALVRRATAFMQLGQFSRAVADLKCACACMVVESGAPAPPGEPSHGEVAARMEKDAELAERLVEVESRKKAGDASFREGKHEEAVSNYSAALKIDPTYVPALVNRAAVHASRGDFAECEEDCSSALSCLGIPDTEESSEVSFRAAHREGKIAPYVPAWGNVRLGAWVSTAALRRAGARLRAGHPDRAIRDFRKALELDPLNMKIQRDLQQATAASLVASGALRQRVAE